MAAFDEQDYTKDFDLNIWKRLLPILARYKTTIIAMIAVNGLTAVIDVAIPLFQQYAIQHFIEADTLDGLPLFALAYLGAILLEAVMVVGFARQAMHVEMYLGRDLRQDLFQHLQTLSLSFYNVTPVGYLITRVMNDTNRIAGNIAWNLTDMAWALLYVIGVFAAMLALNWKLALVVIVVVPVIAVLDRKSVV